MKISKLSLKSYVLLSGILLIGAFSIGFYYYKTHREIKRSREEIKFNKILAKQVVLDDQILNDLKEKGLKDPAYDLLTSLGKHPGLIPVRGVLGGNMAFDDRFLILTNRWVMAGFSDGHYGGYMLLHYEIKKGKIQWKVLKAVCPEP